MSRLIELTLPEEIVRALADNAPMRYDDEAKYHQCALCLADNPTATEHHTTTCAYRMAVEWVAAHKEDQRCAGFAFFTEGSDLPLGMRSASDRCRRCEKPRASHMA